jgi:hypothetical protein
VPARTPPFAEKAAFSATGRLSGQAGVAPVPGPMEDGDEHRVLVEQRAEHVPFGLDRHVIGGADGERAAHHDDGTLITVALLLGAALLDALVPLLFARAVAWRTRQLSPKRRASLHRNNGTFEPRRAFSEWLSVTAGLSRAYYPSVAAHAVPWAGRRTHHLLLETNMSSNMALGIILIVVGAVALFFGFNQSQSLVDQASETFTGRFTESTMWYFFAGAAALAGGAALLIMGRRR